MDSSEFHEFLVSRSSVREFRNEPVPAESITYILDCASTAPSAGNLEAWDVVIVDKDTIREDLSDASYGQEHVRESPTLLVVCANYVRSMSQYGERGILFALQDATIACTYMMLAAHAQNLQTCWVGAFVEEDVKTILGLPAHVRPVAILCVGKGPFPARLTERLPVGEHVHYNAW